MWVVFVRATIFVDPSGIVLAQVHPVIVCDSIAAAYVGGGDIRAVDTPADMAAG